jgi:hypothetical protein
MTDYSDTTHEVFSKALESLNEKIPDNVHKTLQGALKGARIHEVPAVTQTINAWRFTVV